MGDHQWSSEKANENEKKEKKYYETNDDVKIVENYARFNSIYDAR